MHQIIKCFDCGTVIAQCRCPRPEKQVIYEQGRICEECKNISMPNQKLDKMEGQIEDYE